MRINKNLLAVFALAIAVLAGFTIFVQAQTTSTSAGGGTSLSQGQGITFPIAELGNCASQSDCRAYCGEPGNMDACVEFAKTHGLMNGDEAKQAEKFKNLLQDGGGPGGCSSENSCRSYCENISHMDECVAFAKKMGVADSDVKQAEKVLSYVKSGGAMPGGCDSKDSCETYCNDFSHAEECFAFAQKAGLNISQGNNEIPPGQFQKFLELAKNGQTPGGCKTKDQCESYCKDQSHFQECVDFGEKAGFISSAQAQKIKTLGGKGPGGCDSQTSCESYCNDSSHREECFNFAKDHNLIPPEQIKNMQDGLANLRAGLSQAPPEVEQCLKSELGPNVIDDIQSGKLTPGPDIGDKVKNCFEKFGRSGNPGDVFKNAPPEIVSCLKNKLGGDFEKISSGEESPTPDMADAFRVCSQGLRLEQGGAGEAGGGPNPSDMQNFFNSAPPAVSQCLKDTLGSDDLGKIKSGAVSPEAMSGFGEKMKKCFEEFRPPAPPKEFLEKAREQFQGGFPASSSSERGESNPFANAPSEVLSCIKNAIGSEIFDKIARGEQPSPDVQAKIAACFEILQQNIPSLPNTNFNSSQTTPYPYNPPSSSEEYYPQKSYQTSTPPSSY